MDIQSVTDITEGVLPVVPSSDSAVESAEKVALLHEMAEQGLLYGLGKSRTHPKMRQYIFVTRSGVEIIHLERTLECLEAAGDFLRQVIGSGKTALFVGTTPAAKQAVQAFASERGLPYVIERWIGGTLTNFKVVTKRVERLKELEKEKLSGALGKYTKMEQLLSAREIEKMRRIWGGIEKMKDLPGAIFIIDPAEHETAVREAKMLGIPIVAVVNTNADPSVCAHVIPANNRTRQSVEWVLNRLAPFLKEQPVVVSAAADGLPPEASATDGAGGEAPAEASAA
ncbi:MAG: 30S ribosomal protein S2 [Candidatus Colwellbacteria bacterium]|nr:30S ribosomal protein S2 [Candidatus Colwellbacteria bacterium]